MSKINEELLKQSEIILWKLFDDYKKENGNDINMLLFFCDLYRKGLQEHVSCFNDRIHLSKTKLTYQEIKENYQVVFSCDMKNSDDELILKGLSITFMIPIVNTKINKLKKFLITLIENGINGYLTSPFDKEKLIRTEQNCVDVPRDKRIVNTYICNTCKKKFKTAKGFLNHLEQTKHKDNIFEQYGYWEFK